MPKLRATIAKKNKQLTDNEIKKSLLIRSEIEKSIKNGMWQILEIKLIYNKNCSDLN